MGKARTAFVATVLGLLSVPPISAAEVAEAGYCGWKSLKLHNGLVSVYVVPSIGGRIMQFMLGDTPFLWVNPRLAGKVPPPSGLGPNGSWLNYGGDKLWPAPQGWDNDQQWPGPPDAVLDGGPYACSVAAGRADRVCVSLRSNEDKRSGVQFVRTIRVEDGSTRVHFDATMKNIDSKPRRWGIWSHTQLEAANPRGAGWNEKMTAWCPINPKSHFPQGYSVPFGAANNPSFQPDALRHTMRVQYLYRVGKVVLDSAAGWVVTVNGARGAAFVQQFTFESDREYPDGGSVEFWLNGLGSFRAWGKENVMKNDPAENPCVFESELISPFARLDPGQSYGWSYDWYTCRIGADYPALDCSPLALTCEPLTARRVNGKIRFGGRFGVFYVGKAEIALLDRQGRSSGPAGSPVPVSPDRPLVLSEERTASNEPVSAVLLLRSTTGPLLGELARTKIESSLARSLDPWHAFAPLSQGSRYGSQPQLLHQR